MVALRIGMHMQACVQACRLAGVQLCIHAGPTPASRPPFLFSCPHFCSCASSLLPACARMCTRVCPGYLRRIQHTLDVPPLPHTHHFNPPFMRPPHSCFQLSEHPLMFCIPARIWPCMFRHGLQHPPNPPPPPPPSHNPHATLLPPRVHAPDPAGTDCSNSTTEQPGLLTGSCLNNCSSVGKCLGSSCKCPPGRFGLDCSRSRWGQSVPGAGGGWWW